MTSVAKAKVVVVEVKVGVEEEEEEEEEEVVVVVVMVGRNTVETRVTILLGKRRQLSVSWFLRSVWLLLVLNLMVSTVFHEKSRLSPSANLTAWLKMTLLPPG
ncbi:hypothetical protein IWZ03DRAFT_360191 [Phyllosticta citriasiana]|uniref:Transmembrane protein n=1 Tax=Phyllosticta citriasiana TaxID=595635 RepID=A0ABR1KK43_9PEZI